MTERGYNQYEGALTQALTHAAEYAVSSMADTGVDMLLRNKSFLQASVENRDAAHFATISPFAAFPEYLRTWTNSYLLVLQKKDKHFAQQVSVAGEIARSLEFSVKGVKQINAYNKPNPAQVSLWAGFGTALSVLPSCAIVEKLYGKRCFDGSRAAHTLADTHAPQLHLVNRGLIGHGEVSREMPAFGLISPGAKIRGHVVGLNEVGGLSVLHWRKSHGCPILHPPRPGVHAGFTYPDRLQPLPDSTIHTLYSRVVQPAFDHHVAAWGDTSSRLQEISHHDLLVLSGQHPDLPRPNGVQIHPIWEMPPIAGRFIPRR